MDVLVSVREEKGEIKSGIGGSRCVFIGFRYSLFSCDFIIFRLKRSQRVDHTFPDSGTVINGSNIRAEGGMVQSAF